MTAGDSDWQQRDLVPRPDPTLLTNQAIAQVTAQFQAEITHLRELIEARLDAADKAFADHHQVEIRVRDEIEEKVRHLRELTATQLQERDQRMVDASKAGADALAAALTSARELVQLQNQANTREAEKTERSLSAQLEQLSLRVNVAVQSNADRIGELKERIDRGEGISNGTAIQRTEVRASRTEFSQIAAVVVAVISVMIAVASVIALIVKK
jgi:hypothetical protein